MRSPNILAAALAIGACGVSHAAIYKVGTATDTQCTHTTIAAAIAAAAANPGPDTIRIALNQAYPNQALTISSNDDLTIVGGFLGCSRATPEPGSKVVIDGAGASVLRILGDGHVTLRQLEISGANVPMDAEGGGIYYQGNGSLDIADSAIINNVAGYGGGIFARGTGAAAELLIGANVAVANNTARFSGGGIYVDELEMSMVDPNSYLAFNTAQGASASGYGGGLTIRGANRGGYAYIGGSGFGSAGVIFANEAVYGGGVAVVGGDGSEFTDATLRLFTTDASRPGAIRDNFASVAGGGLFMAAYADGFGGVFSSARIWNATLSGNRSPRGAAAYLVGTDPALDYPTTAALRFNSDEASPVGAVSCAAGVPCGSIVDNEVRDAGGDLTEGGVIETEAFGTVSFNKGRKGGVDFRRNAGGRLFLLRGASDAGVVNSVIVDNTTSGPLFDLGNGDSIVEVVDTTIAGNTIGAGHVIAANFADLRMDRSIIWQPGKTTAVRPPLSTIPWSITDMLASETASLGGAPGAINASPRFLDPARGDYGLRVASPAVDYAATRSTDLFDAYGNARHQDLGIVPNASGPVDIGAIERQSSRPLTLNAGFQGDANLWNASAAPIAGTWNWTSALDHTGVAGSGSIQLSGSGFSATGPSQCIHLPSSARYLLNGWGRVQQATNAVALAWQFRSNGGEQCTGGSADRSGEVVISTSTTAWTQADAPAAIDVLTSEWTEASSITITLLANGRDPSGWIDDVLLDVGAVSDTIFADDFDP